MVGKYDGPNDDSASISCISLVVLGVLTVSFGITDSFPWDQIGYWAVELVTSVPDAIHVIG